MTRTTISTIVVSLLLATVSTANAFSVGPATTPLSTNSLFHASSTVGFVTAPPAAKLSQGKSLTSSKLLQASGVSEDIDDVVVIDRDFRLAGMFLGAGALLCKIPWIQLTLGPLVALLGVLFLVQTFRVEFICGPSAFELGGTIKEDENVVVGGENKWAYDKFVNYEFFPKGWEDSPQGPILVYFKEVQTPSEKWGTGPGEIANSEKAVSNGAIPGMVHFFPALCNSKQLKAEWKRRGCQKL